MWREARLSHMQPPHLKCHQGWAGQPGCIRAAWQLLPRPGACACQLQCDGPATSSPRPFACRLEQRTFVVGEQLDQVDFGHRRADALTTAQHADRRCTRQQHTMTARSALWAAPSRSATAAPNKSRCPACVSHPPVSTVVSSTQQATLQRRRGAWGGGGAAVATHMRRRQLPRRCWGHRRTRTFRAGSGRWSACR